MPQERAAIGVTGPVAAGCILAGGTRGAVRQGTGQNVMHVGCVAAAVDFTALLVQGVLLIELVRITMQVSYILRYHDPFRVVPGSLADPVPGIYRRLVGCCRSTKIGSPDPLPCDPGR